MTSSRKWVAILIAVGLTACGGDRNAATSSGATTDGAAAPGPIGVRVGVAYGALALGGDIELQVTCGAGYSNELRLAPSASDGGTAAADLAAVPVGVDCAFTARAMEHRAELSLDVHYSASLTTRFEPSSDHAQVLLVLQQDDGPALATPPTNDAPSATDAAPRIEGLSASGNSATVVGSLLPQLEAALSFAPSAVVVLSAAVDHGGGGALRYRWDDGGAGGTFFDLDPEQGLLAPWTDGQWRALVGAVPTTVWVPPPGMAGTVRLTLIIEEVGDPAPVPRGISVTVAATVDDSRVQAGVSGVLNHWPDVLSMQAVIDAQSAGGQVIPGQRARVDAVVRDVDGDPLAATFAADCPGAFFDAEGQQLSFPLPAPSGEGTAGLTAYFVPATVPASTYCEVTIEVDDGRGGRTRGYLLLKVLTEAPVAYGPIIDFAQSSARTIGPDTEVYLEVDAHSRYGDPVLDYHVDLLSAIAIPQDYLPDNEFKLGGFVGPRTNETGSFAWRSPATEEDCLYAESEMMNAGGTFYFLVTVTDEPAQSAGVPAVNYVVIPADVRCTADQAVP